MDVMAETLINKIWVSRPLFPDYALSQEDVRAKLIDLIDKLYRDSPAFKKVFDTISNILGDIRRIIIAPPTSSAGAYLAIWSATGRPPEDPLIIVAYDKNYEEYTVNLIIHELAHKWIRRRMVDIPNIYDEALAYFLALRAGFKKFYKEYIMSAINVFSKYRPPKEAAGMIRYEISTITFPLVMASILSDNIGIDELRGFLDTILSNPAILAAKLRSFANKQQLKAIGCMACIIDVDMNELKWLLDLGKSIKQVSAEEFFKAIAREVVPTRRFDEREYLYRNLVALLVLPVASKKFGSEKTRTLFGEFLEDAKMCGEEAYDYLDKFIEMPDIFVGALYEAADLRLLYEEDINRALEEAKKYLDTFTKLVQKQ
ncbi:MAG: hypothetical protein Q6363_006640 [Candidatus Njordarchaeota archaeon]